MFLGLCKSHRWHRERGCTPQESAFEATGAWWKKASHSETGVLNANEKNPFQPELLHSRHCPTAPCRASSWHTPGPACPHLPEGPGQGAGWQKARGEAGHEGRVSVCTLPLHFPEHFPWHSHRNKCDCLFALAMCVTHQRQPAIWSQPARQMLCSDTARWYKPLGFVFYKQTGRELQHTCRLVLLTSQRM